MRSTYSKEDVTLLLKDITGMVQPEPTEVREKKIQSGVHYCEMLPIEYVPTEEYMKVYREALEVFSAATAKACGVLAQKILRSRGRDVVLVSLARAGIPAGILLKHFLAEAFGITVPHFSISIIRGRGIDDNAMKYLLERFRPEQLLFVDGWVGKGAILRQLSAAVEAYPGVSPEIAVFADPAYVTELCGTHEDILIPSSCLNCTVSGLISRTFLRSDIIGPEDFHGAVYYGELAGADLSISYLQAIEAHFEEARRALRDSGVGQERTEAALSRTNDSAASALDVSLWGSGYRETLSVAEHFGVKDINLVKPGIGETTRVLLRRVPELVLIAEDAADKKEIRHILRLAEEKNVPVSSWPLRNYKCCGIIRRMADT